MYGPLPWRQGYTLVIRVVIYMFLLHCDCCTAVYLCRRMCGSIWVQRYSPNRIWDLSSTRCECINESAAGPVFMTRMMHLLYRRMVPGTSNKCLISLVRLTDYITIPSRSVHVRYACTGLVCIIASDVHECMVSSEVVAAWPECMQQTELLGQEGACLRRCSTMQSSDLSVTI